MKRKPISQFEDRLHDRLGCQLSIHLEKRLSNDLHFHFKLEDKIYYPLRNHLEVLCLPLDIQLDRKMQR